MSASSYENTFEEVKDKKILKRLKKYWEKLNKDSEEDITLIGRFVINKSDIITSDTEVKKSVKPKSAKKIKKAEAFENTPLKNPKKKK